MSDTIARLFIDDIELVSPKPGPTPTPPATPDPAAANVDARTRSQIKSDPHHTSTSDP